MPHQSPNPFDRIRWTLVIPPRIWIGCRTRQLQPERSLETRVLDSTFPRLAGSTDSMEQIYAVAGFWQTSGFHSSPPPWPMVRFLQHWPWQQCCAEFTLAFHATCVEISSTISNVLRRQMASEGCSAVCGVGVAGKKCRRYGCINHVAPTQGNVLNSSSLSR